MLCPTPRAAAAQGPQEIKYATNRQRNSFRQRTSKIFIANTLRARHGASSARAPTLTTPQAAKKEPRREQYSKEKLAEWREAFNIFDANGDGDIGVQELGNIMKVQSSVGELPALSARAATWYAPADELCLLV